MSDEERELWAHCLAVSLARLYVRGTESQAEWDAFAEEVAIAASNLLSDQDFLSKEADDE